MSEPIDIEGLIARLRVKKGYTYPLMDEAADALAHLRDQRNAAEQQVYFLTEDNDKLKARADAAEEASAQLREALEAVWYEFDQVYDGPESRIPNGLVEVIAKAHEILATTPTGRIAALEALLRDATELFKPTGLTLVRLAEQEWYDKARATLDRK